MARTNTSAYKTFDQISSRLDEIIALVRSKDTSLERSLDLFDEALALGSAAVELVDTTELTPDEQERVSELAAQDAPGAEPGDAGANEPEAQDMPATKPDEVVQGDGQPAQA